MQDVTVENVEQLTVLLQMAICISKSLNHVQCMTLYNPHTAEAVYFLKFLYVNVKNTIVYT